MPEPDLTELWFSIDKTDPSITEALCRDLRSLGVKASVYISPRICIARLAPQEVENFTHKYPDVPTSVTQIIAGQEYPPPSG